jgi:undecaprenyl-diphosphatase
MPDITLLTHLLIKFAWLGNWLFLVLAFVESAPLVGVFIPGATLISIGGFLSSQEILNAWDIIFFASIGAIFGDFFSYSLGRWGGEYIKRKGIINRTLISQGEKFFIRYGNKSIFWGRFFGPIRAIIPFIAGLSRMKRRPFIFWNVLSGISWAIVNVFLGYFSGTLITTIFKKWSNKLTFVLFLFLIIYIFYWMIKKRGQSIKNSFRAESFLFIEYLNNKKWFQNLIERYPFIADFFNESKYAAEKLFASVLVLSFLILVYILILILDIF